MSGHGRVTLTDRLASGLVQWWQNLIRRVQDDDQGPEPPSAVPSTLHCVADAHREWLAARAYFESVEHPDLVDHAVHVLLAAEKRYEFLLREAKSEGLTGGGITTETADIPNFAAQGPA